MAVAGEGESVSYGERPLPQTVAVCRGDAAPDRSSPVARASPSHRRHHARADGRVGKGPDRCCARPDSEDGSVGRRVAARVPGPCIRHRRVQPVLSRILLRPPRRRNGFGSRHLPVGLRRTAGAGARWFPRRVLRLHHPASELRGETHRQDQVAHREVPTAHPLILTELRFDIVRAQTDGQVTSTARLLRDDEVLCIGELNTVASSPEKLTGVQFGKRRDKN